MDEVKNHYNKIYEHFDKNRHTPWPCVPKYLEKFEAFSYLADIGCGNARNQKQNMTELIFESSDFSNLISVTHEKHKNALRCNFVHLGYRSSIFDGVMCIAAFHHLTNYKERELCLIEIHRIVKRGGTALITVWA